MSRHCLEVEVKRFYFDLSELFRIIKSELLSALVKHQSHWMINWKIKPPGVRLAHILYLFHLPWN